MKKLSYLLFLFAIVLMSVSCSKDETETPVDDIISHENLSGIWTFQSFELNGAEHIEYEFDYNDFTYNMNQEGDMFIFDDQIEIYGRNQDGIILKYVFEDNIIKINSYSYINNTADNVLFEVEVLSYNDNLLKLKLKSNEFNDYAGGILTFLFVSPL